MQVVATDIQVRDRIDGWTVVAVDRGTSWDSPSMGEPIVLVTLETYIWPDGQPGDGPYGNLQTQRWWYSADDNVELDRGEGNEGDVRNRGLGVRPA